MKIKYDHTIWPLTISIFFLSFSFFLSLFFHFKLQQNKNRQANPYVTTFGWKLNGQILDILNTSTWTSSSSSLPSSSSLSLNSTTTTATKKINGIEMRNTSLLVTNVNHEHYGHYQCFANNRIGSSQSESVFLNVKCKLLTLFFLFSFLTHHQSINRMF